MKKRKRTLVAGIGNMLKSDDGLGYHVIKQLQKLKLPDNVETFSLDTMGLSTLHITGGYDRVIFIDAIKRRGAPGSIYTIKPEDMAHLKKPIDPQELAVMSMHEVDLERTLAIGKALGEISSDILIIGCEPEDVDTFQIGLTAKVKGAVPGIIKLILEELND